MRVVVRAGYDVEDGGIVRAHTLVAVPWANGVGVTRIIADRPNFRLSLATIAVEGPFSQFPGIVRHFALVAGRVDLSGPAPCFPALLDVMSPPLIFPGDAPVHAVPRSGPALALNLMVPANAPAMRLERSEGGVLPDAVAVFACDAIKVDGLVLDPHDTLFPQGSVRVVGRALVVR